MFFFSSRRRHTRYWRDWSSDVCSSDLADGFIARRFRARPPSADLGGCPFRRRGGWLKRLKCLDRKSVVEGKRVDLGGRRIIKKKKRTDTYIPCAHHILSSLIL